MPLPDLQYDRRASTAGVSTTRHPQASVVAGGDYGGEEACRQPGGPTANSSLRAGKRSVHWSDRQEEEYMTYDYSMASDIALTTQQVFGDLPRVQLVMISISLCLDPIHNL